MPKSKRQPGEQAALSPRMRRHLGQLGLRSLASYQKWCRAHGRSPSTQKSSYDLEEELNIFLDDKAQTEAQSRLHHNPKKLIEAACSGDVDVRQVLRPQLREFCRAIAASPADRDSRAALQDLLLKVNREADFLLEGTSFAGRSYPYVAAVIKLNERRHQWLAELEDWRPASHNSRKQFSSLARHLCARFPVPEFMDQAWFRQEHRADLYRDWFIKLGNGKNVRTFDTPVTLTKLMAHHFLQAPDDYSIEGAIRWGQVHALGGGRRLTDALLGTRIGTNFANNDFWTSVIRFFIANPMLDRNRVGPIIDYLHAQRFEPREVLVGPGRIELQTPPQPNLTMRGRTAERLLDQVEDWHRELGRARLAENLYFKRSGVKAVAFKTGRKGDTVWQVRELLSGAELIAEGKAMRHCVASYARSCAVGRCSIWTLEMKTALGTEKRQTIELNGDRVIIQSRGLRNRLPTSAEFDILRKWADHAGLTISPYVRSMD